MFGKLTIVEFLSAFYFYFMMFAIPVTVTSVLYNYGFTTSSIGLMFLAVIRATAFFVGFMMLCAICEVVVTPRAVAKARLADASMRRRPHNCIRRHVLRLRTLG